MCGCSVRIASGLLPALLLTLTSAAPAAAEELRAQEATLLHRRLPLRELQRQVAGEWRSYTLPTAKLLVINLWSTRCKPCIEEMPFLRRLAAGWRGEHGVRFLFVADPPEENPEAELQAFWRPRGSPLHGEELLRSSDGALRAALDTGVEPITLLVDSDRVVRQAFVGSVVRRGAELAAAMTRLLQILPAARARHRATSPEL